LVAITAPPLEVSGVYFRDQSDGMIVDAVACVVKRREKKKGLSLPFWKGWLHTQSMGCAREKSKVL
jgi:hypothetical protein